MTIFWLVLPRGICDLSAMRFSYGPKIHSPLRFDLLDNYFIFLLLLLLSLVRSLTKGDCLTHICGGRGGGGDGEREPDIFVWVPAWRDRSTLKWRL